jgi:hypothetical protein
MDDLPMDKPPVKTSKRTSKRGAASKSYKDQVGGDGNDSHESDAYLSGDESNALESEEEDDADDTVSDEEMEKEVSSPSSFMDFMTVTGPQQRAVTKVPGKSKGSRAATSKKAAVKVNNKGASAGKKSAPRGKYPQSVNVTVPC